MPAIANPWIDSPAQTSHAADTAAVSLAPATGETAADNFESSMATGGLQEAPAVIAQNPAAPGATDHIHEIFYFAWLLCAQSRLRPNTISPEAIAVCEEIKAHEQTYYSPLPLFLQRVG